MSEKSKKKPQASFWKITIPLWLLFVIALFLVVLNFLPFGDNTIVEYFTITATPAAFGASQTDYTFIEPLWTATPRTLQGNTPEETAEVEITINTPICQDLERTNMGQFVFRMFLQGSTGMDLFRIDEDGSNFCRLTNNSGSDDYPAWSPDGEEIAYVSIDSEYGLYLMDADGSNIELLHTGGTAYSHPAWSPDGRYLVFQATFDEVFDIYRLELETGEVINLTNQERLDNMPAYSPDGQLIVFTSDRLFNPYVDTNPLEQSRSYEIYMMNSDGTNPRRLTINSSVDAYPSFSPDSLQIIYGSHWNSISIINRDGSGERDLINGYEAIWLPDGRIAYVRGAIYTILRDGNEETLMTASVPAFGSGIRQIDYTPAREE